MYCFLFFYCSCENSANRDWLIIICGHDCISSINFLPSTCLFILFLLFTYSSSLLVLFIVIGVTGTHLHDRVASHLNIFFLIHNWVWCMVKFDAWLSANWVDTLILSGSGRDETAAPGGWLRRSSSQDCIWKYIVPSALAFLIIVLYIYLNISHSVLASMYHLCKTQLHNCLSHNIIQFVSLYYLLVNHELHHWK